MKNIRETSTHVFFWNGVFSNFYPCKIRYNKMLFSSTEMIFMWEKALFFGDKDAANSILFSSDPAICKKIGRSIKNFDAELWSSVSYDIMVKANYEKYTQNSRLKFELLNTIPKILVEASPYDKIWGIGLHVHDDAVLDENNWNGQNLLGKALMEVREKINSETNKLIY